LAETILVTPELLREAAWYAGVATALAVVAFAARAPRRRGLLPLAVLAAAMVGGLWLVSRWGSVLGTGSAYDIVREALLAFLAIAVIRSVVLFVAHVVFGRLVVPHILVDVLFILGLLAYALYRLTAIGVNLAGVVTTSAIVTGALAFSAGQTLANLWAGLSLQLENTLRIGDWVRIDDKMGQVVSIRWRSMAIATPANETIVVPNSMLMKERIVVLGRAGEVPSPLRRMIEFRLDYDHAPAKVVQVVSEALQRSELPNKARDPEPLCLCRDFREDGIVYGAIYFCPDLSIANRTDSAVRLLVYAALQRAGMPIPYPRQVVELARRSQGEDEAREHAARVAALSDIELFAVLHGTEREAFARGLRRMSYAANDVVFRKGEAADSLYILAEGTVRILGEDEHGTRTTFAELHAPAYFGEMGLLTGQPRGATVVAAEDVLCYRLDKSGVDAVMQARPAIADSLAQVLVQRQAENDAKLRAAGAPARSSGGAHELVRRIRSFFGLPGAH
jgi:small-conductance mechanosensitive channel